MKLTIKVKPINNFGYIPETLAKGDWIDLRSSMDIHLEAPYAGTLKRKTVKGNEQRQRNVCFDTAMIPLGIAMKLPKGFEAVIVPRSSMFKKYHIIQSNHIGVIDNSYCGDGDEWKLPVVAFQETEIKKGERICQFKIQLSQKATIWQKMKWLFSNGVKIKKVKSLSGTNRGGFGSTGNV
jgi:dUTP pyrophosphatase